MDLRSHSQQQSQSTVGIPEASSSLKLGRRPSFQWKETKEQTRFRLAHDLEIEDWVDAEGGMGAILRYPGTVRVKVPAAIWNNLTLTFQEGISQSTLWTIKILDAAVNQNT